MRKITLIVVIGFMVPAGLHAQTADWSEGATTSDPRANPYGLEEADFASARRAGRLHAQIYPVTATGVLPPYRPIRSFIEDRTANPLRTILQFFFRAFSKVHSINDLMSWIGLHEYPRESDEGIYSIPYPDGKRPTTLVGFGLLERGGATGFTLSCAACHSANLFGKTVLGLTNRFPRCNEAFRRATWASHYYQADGFAAISHANRAELALMQQAHDNLRSVGTKRPLVLGLDTSLAQVALSLDRRNADPIASKSPYWESHPRPDPLAEQPADSKPAVWWNLKYKDRWLSDGSVISGNPVFTNILWNEIGRGADLRQISDWLDGHADTIKELTTAAFSTEAPRFTDFFPADRIDLPEAKRGQILFNKTCAGCHGHYDKAWDVLPPDAPAVELLKTTAVRYHDRTPVIDVGTDPGRRLGMKSLERLNDLDISKRNGTVIRAQNGYVPPPLVGIWARWPYFHNNSAPTLCAVLTRGVDRPAVYYSGEARDRSTDFDLACNGYQLGDRAPAEWRTKEHRYDSARPGLSRFGHDEKIFLRDGKEIFTPEEKMAIVRFLQTL